MRTMRERFFSSVFLCFSSEVENQREKSTALPLKRGEKKIFSEKKNCEKNLSGSRWEAHTKKKFCISKRRSSCACMSLNFSKYVGSFCDAQPQIDNGNSSLIQFFLSLVVIPKLWEKSWPFSMNEKSYQENFNLIS